MQSTIYHRVFLRNFPVEKPIIFVTQWANHPLINPLSCEIEYSRELDWNINSRLPNLLNAIKNRLSNPLPTFDSEIDRAVNAFDTFNRQIQALRTKPAGTQPPALPRINLENTLKIFEYQENLKAECDQKNALYLVSAQEYSQNLARVKAMSEKFGRGKIIKDLELNIEALSQIKAEGSSQDALNEYFETRKQLHRLKTLKQLYQQS